MLNLILINITFEIILFIISEILLRAVLHRGKGRHQTAFIIQFSFIIVCICIIIAIHHIPLILILLAIGLSFKLIFDGNRRLYASRPYVAISKRLKYTSDVAGSDTINDDELTAVWHKAKSNMPPMQVGNGSSITRYPPAPSRPNPPSSTPSFTSSSHRTRTFTQPTSPLRYNHRSSTPTSDYSRRPLISSSSPSPARVGASSPLLTSITSPRTISLTPPGIINTGNTCFAIATIQCLARLNAFVSLCSSFPLSNVTDVKCKKVIESLAYLIKQCHNWNLEIVNVRNFLSAVSCVGPHLVEPQGSGHYQSQQDACEFLLWLLDTLHEVYLSQSQARDVSKIENLKEKKHNIIAYLKGVDCNDVNSYKSDLMELSRLDYNLMIIQKPSTVYKQFCGQLLEARACETCNRMSVNLEYYVILTLPVPAAQSNLNDCFAQFSEIEHLSHTGGNMISCSCNIDYTQAKRLALLSSLPSLLIIQLARFSYDPVKSKAHKNQTSVVFPVTGLDLSKYTVEGKLESETSSKRVYDLSGFCVHTGASSTNFGHYVSYTKVKDGSWYCFNDDYVSLVTDVQNEICSNFVSQNAYILFYIGR